MKVLAVVALAVLAAGCRHSVTDNPLIAAARSGDVTAIHALVKAGADPDTRAGVNNWTALEHAIHKNQPGAVKALLEEGARPEGAALAMAAGYGQADIVRTLLDGGADPRASHDDRTAFENALTGVSDIDAWTAGKCQTDTVRAFLERAPDLVTPQLRERYKSQLARCTEIADLFTSAERQKEQRARR